VRAAHRAAFCDTSGFYALTDRDDNNNEAAIAVIRQLQLQAWTLVTSNYVIAEQHALHLSRLGRGLALRALSLIDRSDIHIVRATVADESRARTILAQYHDKAWSFTDATSFSIMERLDIHYAFSFDNDFSQYGFTRLTPEMLRP
jgi:predicted nucleic acid-binding protein